MRRVPRCGRCWNASSSVVGGLRHLHAAPAAARRRLDQHRIADAIRHGASLRDIGHRAVGARHQRHAETRHRGLGGDLVAHHADMRRRRADEGQAVRFDHLGEAGILRQEAVAGMDRVRAGDRRGRQDRRNIEVAVLVPPAVRCRRSHRPGAHASLRRRRWSAPRRSGCPVRGRRAGCEARSRRGWRSGSSGTMASFQDHQQLRRIPPACRW